MPVYNAEKYVYEAVKSVLNQTFSDFEFIIIDDGSTDNSYKILEGFKDSRIQLLRNKKNSRISVTLNQGLSIAKGKYLARMDADDISRPNRLQKQFDFLENNPQFEFCGTDIQWIGKQTRIEKRPRSYEAVKDYSLWGTAFSHPTFMIRRNIYQSMRYNEDFAGVEDYLLFSDLLQKHKGCNLPEVLLDYRISGEQATFLLNEDGEIVSNPSQKELYYEVFRINLRRIYPDEAITDHLILMENYFMMKERIPYFHHEDFSQFYQFLKRKNTNGVYSNKVIDKIYKDSILDALVKTNQFEGKKLFLESISAFYKNANGHQVLIPKVIVEMVLRKARQLLKI